MTREQLVKHVFGLKPQAPITTSQWQIIGRISTIAFCLCITVLLIEPFIIIIWTVFAANDEAILVIFGINFIFVIFGLDTYISLASRRAHLIDDTILVPDLKSAYSQLIWKTLKFTVVGTFIFDLLTGLTSFDHLTLVQELAKPDNLIDALEHSLILNIVFGISEARRIRKQH